MSKLKKRNDYVMLSVPKHTKELLNILRKDTLSYAKVIDYLLIKSGHMKPEYCSINFAMIDDFVNGTIDNQK